MTYKEKVDFLSKYKKNYFRIKFIDSKITSLRANPIIGNEDEEYHGPGKNLEDYLDEKTMLEKEMRQVEVVIDMIRNENEKYILGYKFLEFLTLEEIAPLMNYSFSWVKKNYRRAINNLNI